MDVDKYNRKTCVLASTGSKFTYYVGVNPDLSVHDMYSNQNVDEYNRIVATRLRLSSHDLAIERGRWSKTPRERRFCCCEEGVVQTEEHVVCSCRITKEIRDEYRNINFENLKEVFKNINTMEVTECIRRCYDKVLSYRSSR